MENITDGNHSEAYWAVDDIENTVKHFITAGARLVQPATNVGGAIQVAIVADPFGNNIGLIQES